MTFPLGISLILFSWFVTDPPGCSKVMPSQPVYHEDTDTLVKSFAVVCKSRSQTSWMLTLTLIFFIIHAIALLAAGLLKQTKTQKLFPTFQLFSSAAVNSMALLVAALLILITLTDHIKQQMTMAVICFTISLTTSLFFIAALVKKIK